MIPIGELRIGNWINEQGLELQVGRIELGLFRSSEPIPLTEEWLVRAGVKRTTGYNEKGIAMLYLKTDYFEVECSFTYIMYLHQLQNLYFALTGEELNFANVK